MAALAALTNAVLGTVIAWVLVRDDFRGKAFVNAVIDLPFALPTIVVGLVIIALYGPRRRSTSTSGRPLHGDVTFTRWAIYLALLFVTLPFVVRTVQPVLIELDPEMEEAARSLGASEFADVPADRAAEHPPGHPLRASTMAFARAVGEIGAIVLITGNLPFRTEVASVFIFLRIDGDPHGAAAVAVVLLAISFAVLLLVGGVRRYATRHERGVGRPPHGRARLPADRSWSAPLAMMVWRTLEDWTRAWSAITDPDTIARVQADARS